jgi:uncharacterized membrane protein
MDAPIRHFTARFRVAVCSLLGVTVAIVLVPFGPWEFSVLAGWDVLAVSLLAWIWIEVGPCDARETRSRATFEDNSRTAAIWVMVVASAVSLVGVVLGLDTGRKSEEPWGALLITASALAIVLGWFVVHSMFMLRYAHLFYEHDNGIDFPGGAEPSYHDFAYLAFTVGTAFAVSDTAVKAAKIRRTVIVHSMVSYVFGAVIIGMAINVTAALIH